MENYTKQIHFHNSTKLPVTIDSWIDGSNTMYSRKINPGEKSIIHSSVGEWHINSILDKKEDKKIWTDEGLSKYTILGKFRSQPCASGNYSWMEWEEIFDCVYSNYDLGGNVKGLITFVYKPENKH
jgi:hypothetical protein